jgi:hypothetical protein
VTNSFPIAAGITYFPRSNRLLVEDKLNLARCAALRSTDYVLDNDRWNREYDCAKAWTAKVFSLN